MKLSLDSSCIVQNTFHSDKIFAKLKIRILNILKKIKKIIEKFVKLCLHLSCTMQNYFHFDEIFSLQNWKFEFLFRKKNHWKICETLFAFMLHHAELLSFWRNFFTSKLKTQTSYFHLKKLSIQNWWDTRYIHFQMK